MTSQQRPDQRHAIAVYENFEHMRDTLEATRNALNTVVTRNKSIVPSRTMHTGRMSCHSTKKGVNYGRTLSDASMLYFADVFYIFFMPALVGQTAERIFTKLSHVVDIRCYLRTY